MISLKFAKPVILAQAFLGWVCLTAVQYEGWDMGNGRCRSIKLKSGILIKNPLAGKASQKKIGKKVSLVNSLVGKKYIQLLLNERIWQGQTFDKPPYYKKN